MISAVLLGVGLSLGAAALESVNLPVAPVKPAVVSGVPSPSSDQIILAAASASGLDYRNVDRLMNLAGYRVADVRAGDMAVPRVYAPVMPPDMGAIESADERKRIFIKLMLPLVLDANERLLVDRAHLLYLMSLEQTGLELSFADRRWLAAMYDFYEVAPGDATELLARVDMIPPSLMLAQAAQESGWGTSRFTHEGNALFGQRIWETGSGLVPEERAAGQNHEVRAFDGLRDSVLAYMVNLNRHEAYDDFRTMRASYRETGRTLDGHSLAGGLGGYSEEGRAYIEKIRSIMQSNDLSDFDTARLADLLI